MKQLGFASVCGWQKQLSVKILPAKREKAIKNIEKGILSEIPKAFKAMEASQKFEDEAGELDMTEDYVVFDDATTGSAGHLDLSNLRKRKTKIISSAKETIENGE